MKKILVLILSTVVPFLSTCAPKRFDWNNYCSQIKECPPDKWCFIDIGPDGEPFQYGQCVEYED